MINVNLMGVFNCTKEVVPYMMEAGKGKVINTTSVVGFRQLRPDHAASKFGVIGRQRHGQRNSAEKI